MSENDSTNDKNIDRKINAPKQDSNSSSSGRPICIRRPAERHRSFVQHVTAHANDGIKNVLIDKKKNR